MNIFFVIYNFHFINNIESMNRMEEKVRKQRAKLVQRNFERKQERQARTEAIKAKYSY
jgi:hypothetical protein